MEFPFSRTFGAGTHQLGATDINVLADTSDGAVNFVLPSISSAIESSARQGYGIGNIGNGTFGINITDIANNASVNNITITCNPDDKFNSNAVSVVINENSGAVSIKPTSSNIWTVGSGGSGGSSALPFGNDTGVSNAYQVAIVGATLTDGYLCEVRIANTNTGASTLQINALGTKPLVDTDLNPLAAGDIEDNSIYLISYNFAVDSYQVMGLAKLATSSALPIVRYVYLVQDASDATRMGGTADNVYTTAQAAYNAALALQTLNGGIVVIRVGNITQASSGNISLSANMLNNISNHIAFEGSGINSNIGDIVSNGFNVNLRGNNIKFGNITTTSNSGANSGTVTITLTNSTVGNISTTPATTGNPATVSITSKFLVIGDISTSGNESSSASTITIVGNVISIQNLSANGGLVGDTNGNRISLIGDIIGAISAVNLTATGNDNGNGGRLVLTNAQAEQITTIGGSLGGNAGNLELQYSKVSNAIQEHYGAGSPILSLDQSQITGTLTQTNNSTSNFATSFVFYSSINQWIRTATSTGNFGVLNTKNVFNNVNHNAYTDFDVTGLGVVDLDLIDINVIINGTVGFFTTNPNDNITNITNLPVGQTIRIFNPSSGTGTLTFVSGTIKTKGGVNTVIPLGGWIDINNDYTNGLLEVNNSN